MDLLPQLAGLDWMDPQWLLDKFGQEMFWVSVAIVFVECGLLFPILPGDSLLFSVGLFINTDDLDVNIVLACVVFSIAAFLGNVTGYEIGRRVGPAIFHREGRFLNIRNFEKSHAFFERYGNRALVLGRFVPIVRTFITLVAARPRWTVASSSSGPRSAHCCGRQASRCSATPSAESTSCTTTSRPRCW